MAGPVGLYSGNSSFFCGRPSWEATEPCNYNLGTRGFLVAGPVGRPQGYNCNLGTRDFVVAGTWVFPVRGLVYLAGQPGNECPHGGRWSGLFPWVWAVRLSVRCEMNGLFYTSV